MRHEGWVEFKEKSLRTGKNIQSKRIVYKMIGSEENMAYSGNSSPCQLKVYILEMYCEWQIMVGIGKVSLKGPNQVQ